MPIIVDPSKLLYSQMKKCCSTTGAKHEDLAHSYGRSYERIPVDTYARITNGASAFDITENMLPGNFFDASSAAYSNWGIGSRLPRPMALINPSKWCKYRQSGEEHIDSDDYAFIADFNSLQSPIVRGYDIFGGRTTTPNYAYFSEHIDFLQSYQYGDCHRNFLWRLVITKLKKSGTIRFGYVRHEDAYTYPHFPNVSGASSWLCNWLKTVNIDVANGENQEILVDPYILPVSVNARSWIIVNINFDTPNKSDIVHYSGGGIFAINVADYYLNMPVCKIRNQTIDTARDFVNVLPIDNCSYTSQPNVKNLSPEACKFSLLDHTFYEYLNDSCTRNPAMVKNAILYPTNVKYSHLDTYSWKNDMYQNAKVIKSVNVSVDYWGFNAVNLKPQMPPMACISGNDILYSNTYIQQSGDRWANPLFYSYPATHEQWTTNSADVSTVGVYGGKYSKMVCYISDYGNYEHSSKTIIICHLPGYVFKGTNGGSNNYQYSEWDVLNYNMGVVIDKQFSVTGGDGSDSGYDRVVLDVSDVFTGDQNRCYYICCKSNSTQKESYHGCLFALVPMETEQVYPNPIIDSYSIVNDEVVYDGNTLFPGVLKDYYRNWLPAQRHYASGYEGAHITETQELDVWAAGVLTKTYPRLESPDQSNMVNKLRQVVVTPNTTSKTKSYRRSIPDGSMYTKSKQTQYDIGNQVAFCGQEYPLNVSNQEKMTQCLVKPNEHIFVNMLQEAGLGGIQNDTVTFVEVTNKRLDYTLETSLVLNQSNTFANWDSTGALNYTDIYLLDVANISGGSSYSITLTQNTVNHCMPMDIWISWTTDTKTAEPIPWDDQECTFLNPYSGLEHRDQGLPINIISSFDDFIGNYMAGYVENAPSGSSLKNGEWYYSHLDSTNTVLAPLKIRHPGRSLQIFKYKATSNICRYAVVDDNGKVPLLENGKVDFNYYYSFKAPVGATGCSLMLRKYDAHLKRPFSNTSGYTSDIYTHLAFVMNRK